jgi:hypothetical protein
MTFRAGRTRAIALLLVLLTGGLGPVLDAVLFHSAPGEYRSASHVEQPGGCGAHAEHCAVVGSFSRPQWVGSSLRAELARADAPRIEIHRAVVPARSLLVPFPRRSRAPPALLA